MNDVVDFFEQIDREAREEVARSIKLNGHDPHVGTELLRLAHWVGREIATPVFLLGEVVSTTSRVEVIGPTGLGKTNLGIAWAFAMADGADFLHWRGSGKPQRILYIDGEMSRRVMKQRLLDAIRRHGSTPATLFVLSREDFPDMAPLNTEAGQQFIDRFIEALGGIDCLLVDNVQSLLIGDMKDPEAWQDTLPWVRDLTRRCIGQVWFHHTGHDTSHGYGDKSREWQLDTVILMEEAVRPEADLAFSIKFTKARERTPDNRAAFDETVITLTGDEWASERRRGVSSRQEVAKDRALTLLIDAVARHGAIPPTDQHIPHDTPCVEEGVWKRACAAGTISKGSPEAQDRAFRRAATKLEAAGLVGKAHGLVWVVKL